MDGVLIKNMTMPKSCYSDEFKYCPFLFFDYDTKSHCGLSDDIRCTKTRRPKGCPLVEVEQAPTLEDAKSAYLKGHNLFIQKGKEN